MNNSITNYPDGVSSFGIPLLGGAGIPFTGNYYFVRPADGSDANNGTTPATAFKTLAFALTQCKAGNNDVVYLIAESNTASATTDYQSANLNWNKDGVHLIGINNGSFLGQRSRISANATSAPTAFANLFTLSANNCLIANIEFFQGAMGTNPSAASTCFTLSGQRNRIVNCQISGIGDTTLDDVGSNSLTISGSENYFQHCYIGLDTVIRATSVTEVVISAGARNLFEDCQFETYTSGSTFKMVSINTACDRWIKFKNCEFHAVQNITSAVAPTGLLGLTTMNGEVLLVNPYCYGFAQYTTADNNYARILGFNGDSTTHLVGLAGNIDAA